MNVTPAQIQSIQRLWRTVCKDRGWKASDRDFRLAKFSELLGRPVDSLTGVERIKECTKLFNELKAMLGVSLQAAREADDTTINDARVLRNQILTELIPCLELYVTDVRAYLTAIMEDKNRWWKIDRPACDITMMYLDAKPIFHRDRRTGEQREFPSQLQQLQFTISARLHAKRKDAGHTIHDMKVAAHVPCHCSLCRKMETEKTIAPISLPVAAKKVESPF